MTNGIDLQWDLYHSKEREKLYKEMYFKSATEPLEPEYDAQGIFFDENWRLIHIVTSFILRETLDRAVL